MMIKLHLSDIFMYIHDLVKLRRRFSLTVLHFVLCWYLTNKFSGAKGARTDKIRNRERMDLVKRREPLWKFKGARRENFFKKKTLKTFGGYDKISYLCIRFSNDGKQEEEFFERFKINKQVVQAACYRMYYNMV